MNPITTIVRYEIRNDIYKFLDNDTKYLHYLFKPHIVYQSIVYEKGLGQFSAYNGPGQFYTKKWMMPVDLAVVNIQGNHIQKNRKNLSNEQNIHTPTYRTVVANQF